MPVLPHTLGRFTWHELYTRDVAAAKDFYAAMFGWSAEERPMGPGFTYTLFKSGEKQVGGMIDIAQMPPGGERIPPHWAVYVTVADVDEAVQQVAAVGGRVLAPCMDVPGVGRFVPVHDPQEGFLFLLRSAEDEVADGEPGRHEFCWESLSSTDPAGSRAFYQQVVGWGTAPMGEGENQVTLFTRQGEAGPVPVASLGQAPDGGRTTWSSFVAVEDVVDSTARCRELGGSVLVEPTEIPEVGMFAMLEDPTGAQINLFQAKQP